MPIGFAYAWANENSRIMIELFYGIWYWDLNEIILGENNKKVQDCVISAFKYHYDSWLVFDKNESHFDEIHAGLRMKYLCLY